MWLRALADADASCGGKAVGLARLIRAGVPVPDGFVLDDRAFAQLAGEVDVREEHAIGHVLAAAAQNIAQAELPAPLHDEVVARARALGVVAVRSSATIEDADAGSAAGVFSSVSAVPADEVWAAIRVVWQSALTPLAAAYARRRGGRVAIGVIVQRFVTGTRATVYTRPPGAPARDELLLQRGGDLLRLPRTGTADPAGVLALAAERAISADGGADVELVEAGDRRWVVQARPIVHPTTRPRTPPPPSVLAPLVADGRRWTWDVTHNPDPLSPAQVGLVERVEAAGIAPWSLRVCAGYLYAAPLATSSPELPATADALSARAADIEARIAAALGDDEPPTLAAALERYLAFYRLWAGELATLIAGVRATIATELPVHRPSAVEATLLAAARGELDEAAVLARLGDRAPAWDVAVPTYGERPEIVRAAIDRARDVIARLAEPSAPATPELAAVVLDLGERDDAWFARAQAMVRASLRARARALAIDPDDIFWLPLAEVLEATALDADDVRRRAAGARAAADRAGQWDMPVVVGGPAPALGPPLAGVGTGPRVSGRVVRFGTLAAAVTIRPGDVVVTRAVTPALAVLVIGCAALVSETGGLLDHGAALARELGIPCVVGCRDAWSLLADGMVVTVDGDAGTIERLDAGG